VQNSGNNRIEIEPQKEIGNYRVDFLISHLKVEGNDKKTINSIVVECDSQTFHERTEGDRRYEKKRDRKLLQQDLKIFHYTGKEIIESPFKVAHDIIENLTGSEWEGYEIIKIDADSLRGDFD
jgi:very-short-patch-repair endonuclease